MSDYSYEFLGHRGINPEVFRFYNSRFKVKEDGEPVAIGFTYPNSATKVRNLGEKEFYWVGTPEPGLFGRNLFSNGSHKYVTITEGELDALSLYQVIRSPVVSVQSAASAVRDCTSERSWLNSFERVYLAFDNDAAGRDATAQVAKLFDYNKVYHVRYDTRKDANEFLQAGDASSLVNIWHNAKKYLPENIVSSYQDFKKILSEQTPPAAAYPFRRLNEMTYGIRKGESVLITAQEGVGKTEVMHAIEHQLLKETDSNVGAIFLEEPKRRHLQALAGIQLKKPIHLPDCSVTETETYSALTDVLQKDERLHVYSHFGSDDPDVLLDTIRFMASARNCDYILLDHISMVVSGLAGDDERRALDYLSTRLEMMVKELNFALILVSHVNDQGQTRGSRYISKIADIRIDLFRDQLNPDPLIRNITAVSVSKNRFSGKTGPAGDIIFDPTTYTYQEEPQWISPSEVHSIVGPSSNTLVETSLSGVGDT